MGGPPGGFLKPPRGIDFELGIMKAGLSDLEILQRPHPQMAGFATNEAASKEKTSKEAPSKEKASKEAASKEQASKEATSNRKHPTPGEGGVLISGGFGPPHEDSLHGQ